MERHKQELQSFDTFEGGDPTDKPHDQSALVGNQENSQAVELINKDDQMKLDKDIETVMEGTP